MDALPLWIDGREVSTAHTIDIHLPYDGSLVGRVHAADAALAQSAIAAACRAAPVMRALTRHQRSAILRQASARLSEQRDEFAQIIASESGKPLREARLEVQRGAATLLFSSEEADRLAGEAVPMDASTAGRGRWGMTVREPVGVVAAITPFNFPLNLSLHKIGPAIAAGNAVVHKPASATPMTALRLARLLHECGLPPGALNVVAGPGGTIGDVLVQSPDIHMITFTGSAPIGERIRANAGLKRVTLELGSNSAVVVEPDADVAAAVQKCATGAYAHSGQVCISVQRIFVARPLLDQFTAAFSAAAARLKQGHPLDPATEISSLITPAEAERVHQWVDEAVQAGARVVAEVQRDRSVMGPVIVRDVPPHTRLAREEAFGPVVGITGYDTLGEAIALVNSSDFGLQASIFTRDLERAFTAAQQVHVGGFHINEAPSFRADQMPYGGVKRSGTGREGPHYAIEEMTEPKLITWNV